MSEKQRALYRGDRKRFVNGVPARNLSEDDWNSLDSEHQAEVRTSDLYDVRTDAEMRGSTTPNTPTASAKAADTKPAGDSA